MEWLQAIAAIIVALVAIARLFLDWREKRHRKMRR